jgi:hypothetical protein
MTIGGVFLDAFRTKRRNLYKSREQVLEILVEKLRVKTLRGKSVYSRVWQPFFVMAAGNAA